MSETLMAVSDITLERAQVIDYYDPNANTWNELPKLNIDRSMFGGIMFENKLFLVGGTKDGSWLTNVDAYDFETGQFTKMPPISAPAYDFTLVVLSGYLYIIGGIIAALRAPFELSIVERYNPQTMEWEVMPEIPVSRRKPQAVAYNGEIYVIGGAHEGISLSEIVAFNPTTKTWRNCAPMNEKRHGVAVALLGNYIYAFSGHDRYMIPGVGDAPPSTETNYLKSAERYDPVSDSWTMLEDSNWLRTFSKACNFNNSIVIAGGTGLVDEHFRDVEFVEQYDPVENKFSVIAPMTIPRIFFDLILVPTKLIKKSIALKNKDQR